MADDQTELSVALDVIDALLSEWDDILAEGIAVKPRQRKTQAQAALVLAFGSHIRSSVELLRPHLAQPLPVAFNPVVRAIYETGITIIWIDKNTDAAEAMMNEYIRQRGALKREMESSTAMSELASQVTHADLERMETTQGDEAQWFKQRVKSLGHQGTDLYVLYRQMSGRAHPGVELADAYLTDTGDEDLVVRARPTGHGEEPWIVAAGLVWATRVACHYFSDERLRNRVRRMARELGMTSDL